LVCGKKKKERRYRLSSTRGKTEGVHSSGDGFSYSLVKEKKQGVDVLARPLEKNFL